MSLLLAIVVWVVVVAILCWIVSLVPLPPTGKFPLRNVLYLVVAIFALIFFLDIVGVTNLIGWHPSRLR